MLTKRLYGFGWLLWRDIRVIKTDFLNNVIDASVFALVLTVVNGYIMPELGVSVGYGAFMLATGLAFACQNASTWIGGAPFVADFSGERAIMYELTLPLPTWAVFLKNGLSFAIQGIALNLLILPIGKLLLQERFSFEHFSLPKFVLMYGTINLLFAFYALLIAVSVRGMKGNGRFWLRYGIPLTFFSGFQFSWQTLSKAAPLIAQVNLINPLMYGFEGLRASVLGAEGSLPYWISLAGCWLGIVFFGTVGFFVFRKRLDCL